MNTDVGGNLFQVLFFAAALDFPVNEGKELWEKQK